MVSVSLNTLKHVIVMRNAPTALWIFILVCLVSCRDKGPVVVPEVRFPVDISGAENEVNNVFRFPLVLDVSTTRDVTVHYETRSLTATEGEDFIAAAGSVVFPAGTASASIDVEIVVDDLKEEDEQFRVVLTGSEGCVFAEGIQEALGTIRNDDSILATPQGGYDAATSYPGKTLVWSDEFDNSNIDLTHWTYDLGGHGWGNQELQVYTNQVENAYVANGNLMIVAEDKGSHYTSA